MQVVRLDFGPGIENCQRRGSVGKLLFVGGDDEVGWAVRIDSHAVSPHADGIVEDP